MFCVRVSEQMLLIDAVKDLLNHVCLASEKTTINGAVDFFTSQMSQTQDKTSGINFAGDKVVQSIAEETCAKDCLSEPSYEDEENGVKDVAVAAADTDWSVRDAVKPERHLKLFIQLHSRSQKMPLRYCVLLSHITGFIDRLNAVGCEMCQNIKLHKPERPVNQPTEVLLIQPERHQNRPAPDD